MEKHTNKARHSHNNNCKQPDINKSLPKFSGFQVAYIEIDIDMVEVPALSMTNWLPAMRS